jgi:PTS system nitrogen regulatory IIA component
MVQHNDNQSNNAEFNPLIDSQDIICHTTLTDRDTILTELLQLLAKKHHIRNIEEIYHILQERENDMPSVAGPGIALPHARLDELSQITIGIVTSKGGFSYTGDGENIIHLLILILAPKADPDAYLHTMSSLAKICKDPDTADQVAKLTTSENVWEFFKRGELTLPRHSKEQNATDSSQA